MGVIKAINTVRTLARENPDTRIYVLGMLVHNRFVVEALNGLNVITLDDPEKTKLQFLDEIDDGIVVFTAHGISDEIKKHAVSRGLKTMDASCPFVLNNRALIISYLEQDYDVLYIGKKKHPEAEAILSLSDRIHLITGSSDLEELMMDGRKLFVTNQTTMSMYDIDEMMKTIRDRYHDAVITPEVCDATRMRQQAVMNLQNIDALVVVGDPTSNNTSQLATIAHQHGISHVFKVETARDLHLDEFEDSWNVAVTAGASTPGYLTSNVIEYLRTADEKYLVVETEKMLDQ